MGAPEARHRCGSEPVHLAQHDLSARQSRHWANDDATTRRIQSDHVERLTVQGEAEAAALPHSVVNDATMTSEQAPIDVDNLAGFGGAGLDLLNDGCVSAFRNEADILAVGLGCHGKLEPFGNSPGL